MFAVCEPKVSIMIKNHFKNVSFSCLLPLFLSFYVSLFLIIVQFGISCCLPYKYYYIIKLNANLLSMHILLCLVCFN